MMNVNQIQSLSILIRLVFRLTKLLIDFSIFENTLYVKMVTYLIQVINIKRLPNFIDKEIEDENILENTLSIQMAIDHWLYIKSLTWVDYIITQLSENKVEPLVGITALSEIIKVFSLQEGSRSSENISRRKINPFWRRK